jgi:hypothetical protein
MGWSEVVKKEMLLSPRNNKSHRIRDELKTKWEQAIEARRVDAKERCVAMKLNHVISLWV